MGGAKFFRIGMLLSACILALLLVGEADFISVAWAKKPPKTETGRGYAMLRDAEDDMIVSDGVELGGVEGLYGDINLGGEDEVKIETDLTTGDLVEIMATLGQLQGEGKEEPPIDYGRRAQFRFGFPKADFTGEHEEDRVLYDILSDTLGNVPPHSVHVRIRVWQPTPGFGWRIEVAFRVDGITRTALESSGVDPAKYWLASGEDWQRHWNRSWDQLVYYLLYPETALELTFAPPIWTLTLPSNEPVDLYVFKSASKGKGRPGAYNREVLATYASIPFGLAVSLNSLEGYPVSLAPRKHSILSAVWGEIRAR